MKILNLLLKKEHCEFPPIFLLTLKDVDTFIECMHQLCKKEASELPQFFNALTLCIESQDSNKTAFDMLLSKATTTDNLIKLIVTIQ